MVGQVVQSQTVLYTVWLSSYNFSEGCGIAVDSQNHAVYVTGVLGDSEESSLFLAKYNDTSEEMVYNVTKGFGTSSGAFAIVLNGSESIYMAGSAFESPSNIAIFFKFATNGTLIFSKMVEGIAVYSDIGGVALAIDKENNIILTGTVFINAGEDEYDDNIFIMKYSPSGDLIFTKLYGTSTRDEANGIGIDSLNNIYLTGFTYGNLNGQTNSGNAFLMKLNSTGSVLYTRLFGYYGGYASAN
eukprot:scaffold2278_cov171-Ochromonas_danica.AAC.7